MSQKTVVYCKSAVILGFVLIFLLVSWREKTVQGQIGQNEKTAGQIRKNIQVLKEMPDSQLLPVMHQMRTALGVRCDYCHIAENDSYWKDDKSEKQIARRMIQMTLDINKANYDGKPVVTCNTCHRGQTEPVPVPAIGQGAFTNATKADADVKLVEPLSSADQIIDKYIQAIGGKAAIESVKTRYTKLSLQRPKLVNSGTPKAAVINRGETWTIETYRKAPDKYLAVIRSPEGIISQGYNGTSGWVKTSEGQREMNAAEVERIKREADLYTDLRLKEQFSTMTLIGKEKIDNRETYVIEATRVKDKKIEKLFFDAQNGLLLRRTVFTETILGSNPEQTDFEDYRMVNGIRIPFVVRVSYLDDNHYGTTRSFIEVKNNITLSDEKFNLLDGQKK